MVLPCSFAFGSFKVHGNGLKSRIVEKVPKGLKPHLPFTDHLVTILARTERPLAVVEVESENLFKADRFIQLFHRHFIFFRLCEFVACSERMAGVDADSDAFGYLYPGQNRTQLGKIPPEV